MRKVIPLLVVVALVVAVGSAAAKTVAVTISRDGFVPKSVTIAQGDTVQFTNSDSIVHQIAFRSMTGVTCSGSPLVLQTGFSGSCTFANAGNFTYSDPNTRGNTFRGTVTVTAAPLSLSLSAKPLLVTYGAAAALAGTLSTQQAGENVDVLAQPCGDSLGLEVHDGADDCGRRLHGDCQADAEHGVLDEVESRDEHRHHRSRPAEHAAGESRSRSLLAPRPRRVQFRRQVRELPALQRHPSSVGRRQDRAPEGELDRSRAHGCQRRLVPFLDPRGPPRPGDSRAGPGRKLLRGGTQQHDSQLGGG